MNTDVFFENFELLAEAPNGVQKLRELILQLAVMGELVPQDSNDEPASVLVEKIKEEKEKLVKDQKIKKFKYLPFIDEDKLPFNLPENWKYVRIDEVCFQVTDGVHSTPKYISNGVPFLSVNNLRGNKLSFENSKYISSETHDELTKRCKPEKYDLLLGKVGSIGVCDVINTEHEFSIFVQLALLKPAKNFVDSDYMKYAILSRMVQEQILSGSAGSALQYIGIGKIQSIILPLPPLAEQKRIVAKVDELMALCDKLKTRRQKKQEIQSKLNSAALDRMLSAENQDEFEQNWQRICENFDLLYDNPENVGKLKQAILQLAVQGKVVEQDSEDEPVSVLIEKITAEKRRLIKEGKIKKTKASAQIDSQEVPYELPDKWEWIRIEDITDIGTGSTPLTSKHDEYYENGSIPWITSSLTSLDYIDKAETYITETAVNECNLRMYPSGTLLVALYGQGKTRGQVSELRIEATINQACASIVFIENFESIKKYVKLFFEKKYEELRALSAGGAQPNINVGKIKETLIPLPPLEEQKSIVEKVEQLMGLCDELEVKLRKSREDSEKLMEAVVKCLLEGAAA